MEFINGYHFQYEFFKHLRSRGLVFTPHNFDHPLHPDNQNNFNIRCLDSVATIQGAPRFSQENDEDQFVFTPLINPHEALDAFIAAQLAKPAAERKFPYEVVTLVHGHHIKLSTTGLAGRRPNSVYPDYPVLTASIEAPMWSLADCNENRRNLVNAGIEIPPRINQSVFSGNHYNYGDIIRKWTSTDSFLSDSIDRFLEALIPRFNNWKAVAQFICFFNASQETIRRRTEEERRRREEEERLTRERLERERAERERIRAQEGLARTETRISAFSNFAPKKKKLERSAQENLEKFLMAFDATNLQVVEADSTDLTPSVSLEYDNGVEIEVVATDKGIFIKNCIVPQNLIKKTLELFKTIKE